MQLANSDITTTEVFTWQGLHLLHYAGSTCSKKIRIMLQVKHLDWVSHPVDLIKHENNSQWFMGINPRGLVPVLVHNGQVHIESNDILDYLEQQYPLPALMPKEQASELKQLLKTEDDLHIDLRNLTLRFTAPTKLMQRSQAQLHQYQHAGTGLVDGKPDLHKAAELQYWREFAANKGITDEQVRQSAQRFKQAFGDLEHRLQAGDYLLGNHLSLADIAWFVNINRLLLAGYPIKQLHPRLWAWRQRLLQQPAFAKEAPAPMLQTLSAKVIQLRDKLRRKSMAAIAAF